MKISVRLTIDVEPSEWHAVYGNGDSASEVRQDVREYVLNAVQCLAGIEDSDATVTLHG